MYYLQMGWIRWIRHSCILAIYTVQNGFQETVVHRPLAWHGYLFHRHDPSSRIERAHSQDDRPRSHHQQVQPAKSVPLRSAHHSAFGRIREENLIFKRFWIKCTMSAANYRTSLIGSRGEPFSTATICWGGFRLTSAKQLSTRHPFAATCSSLSLEPIQTTSIWYLSLVIRNSLSLVFPSSLLLHSDLCTHLKKREFSVG